MVARTPHGTADAPCTRDRLTSWFAGAPLAVEDGRSIAAGSGREAGREWVRDPSRARRTAARTGADGTYGGGPDVPPAWPSERRSPVA